MAQKIKFQLGEKIVYTYNDHLYTGKIMNCDVLGRYVQIKLNYPVHLGDHKVKVQWVGVGHVEKVK